METSQLRIKVQIKFNNFKKPSSYNFIIIVLNHTRASRVLNRTYLEVQNNHVNLEKSSNYESKFVLLKMLTLVNSRHFKLVIQILMFRNAFEPFGDRAIHTLKGRSIEIATFNPAI